ncbi:hypothetical protein [uncultured Acidaminococcus sp.]|jgi:hypothetical protein|uniref:hypothetical protein n=1 Tax=uncultured Acidaminococcus sp. TaxID=352152 RepID=UPI0026700676|nr:hypothetical protein [uncultured Acidaminococcus sp.]
MGSWTETVQSGIYSLSPPKAAFYPFSRGFDFIKQFSDSGDQGIIHVYALKTKNIENQKIRDIAATLSKCALPQTIYIINEHLYKLEKSGILRKGQANQ